jgi:hypothetical protein
MAWTDGSRMFREFIKDPLLEGVSTGATGYADIVSTDTIKAALFNNSVTPDKDAAVASTGYNTGTWTTGNEKTDTNWPAGGIALGTKAKGTATGAVYFDAADTTHSSTVTLSDVHGCLVYDDSVTAGTVADQGICCNYFGGAQSVTAGTFTIVWHSNGVFRFTV